MLEQEFSAAFRVVACTHRSVGILFFLLSFRDENDVGDLISHKFAFPPHSPHILTSLMRVRPIPVSFPPAQLFFFSVVHHFSFLGGGVGAWNASQQVISTFIDPGTAEKIRLVSGFEDSVFGESFTRDTIEARVAFWTRAKGSGRHAEGD